MLILTRRIGEVLYVGDDVQVNILGIKGRHVRLGILAPKDIAIHRKDVYERIKSEKECANSSAPDESTQGTQAGAETVVARKIASGR